MNDQNKYIKLDLCFETQIQWKTLKTNTKSNENEAILDTSTIIAGCDSGKQQEGPQSQETSWETSDQHTGQERSGRACGITATQYLLQQT